MRHALSLLCCSSLLAISGCAGIPNAPAGGPSELGPEVADEHGRIPTPLAPYIAADRAEGARNAVLNAMLAGQHALDIGATTQARAFLDAAYRRIEVIYADNPAAKAARSKFVPEARKEFKGEPYERAMVGYYLGLTDMLAGDLDNARSAWRWGNFQDTMSAAEEYQADMAALDLLVAWTYQCQGRTQDAMNAMRIAQQHRPALPTLQPDDHLLVLFEAGPAPRKLRKGKHGEALGYDEREPLDMGLAARVLFDDRTHTAVLAEDLHWQATTLGGRRVDSILAGKASFKDGAQSVAQAGAMTALVGTQVMSSASMQGNHRGAEFGGALALGGLLANLIGNAVAQATRPEADTRAWHTLPAAVFATAAPLVTAMDAPVLVRAQAPDTLGGGESTGEAVRVPGTPCRIARVAQGATARGAWQPTAPQAWMTLGDAERLPPPRLAEASAGARP
jgi:hypothetical protein